MSLLLDSLKTLIAIIILLFALITLFLSSSVIFDLFDIRAREGNYVSIVVWANFITAILYLFAAYGLWLKKIWTVPVLVAAIIILAAAFFALLIYIKQGGLFETKTISALFIRIGLTLCFTFASYFIIKKTKN